MLFVKSAIVILIVLAAFIPIAIYLMLRNPETFDNVRKLVRQQYPSLFHRESANHNGNG